MNLVNLIRTVVRILSNERIALSGQAIELSEFKTYIELTNRLCYYGEPNKNKVVLPVDTAEEKAKTLVDMPVVAKYKVINGNPDIGGHEMVTLPDGTVKFNTANIGTHVAVEVRDDTVIIDDEEKTLPCLFAKSKIWTRNTNIVAAIKRLFAEGKLFSSWEIATLESEEKNGLKYLTDYVFEANCLLGTGKAPAYGSCATAISVAEVDETPEMIIAEALSKDMKMEDKENMKNEKNTSEITPEVTEPATHEVSELTCKDIREKIEDELCKQKFGGYVAFMFPTNSYVLVHKWDMDELTFNKVTYTVENDVVTIGKPEEIKLVVSVANINSEIAAKDEEISEKNDALIEADCKKKELEAEIKELSEYKAKYESMKSEKEAAELAEKQNELKEYAVKSGYITSEEIETSEEIKKLIAEVDTLGVKSVIVDRLMASINKISETEKKKTEEVSETKPNKKEIVTSSLIDSEAENKDSFITDPNAIISQYINRK